MDTDPNLNLTPLPQQSSLPHFPCALCWPHPPTWTPQLITSPTLEQMRRFRRVHTTTSLSGCLGVRTGGSTQSGPPTHPASLSPPGSSCCPRPPPPGEGLDSSLSGATRSRVRPRTQGGAPGRRAKAPCGSVGIMQTGSERDRDIQRQKETHKPRKGPARDTQAQRH